MSTSAGLNPRAMAGGPSVTKFTHSSCTGIIHSGIWRAAVRNMDITSPTLEDIMYLHIKGTMSKMLMVEILCVHINITNLA